MTQNNSKQRKQLRISTDLQQSYEELNEPLSFKLWVQTTLANELRRLHKEKQNNSSQQINSNGGDF